MWNVVKDDKARGGAKCPIGYCDHIRVHSIQHTSVNGTVIVGLCLEYGSEVWEGTI